MDFHALSPITTKILVLIWLVAAENVDGTFDDDPGLMAFRLRMSVDLVAPAMLELKAKGFLVEHDAAHAQPKCQSAGQVLAQKNGFGSRHISDKVKRAVWDRDQGKCNFCGATKDIEFDHIKPVSAGGTSEILNIQLLCRPCNRKKRISTAAHAEHIDTHAQPSSEHAEPRLGMRTSETETETETETEKSPRHEKAYLRSDTVGEFWSGAGVHQ